MDTEARKLGDQILDKIRSEIESHTNNQLERLELKCIDGEISIFASAGCYYDVQMVLVAMQHFVIEKPKEIKINIELSVEGHSIKLSGSDLSQ